MKFATFFTAATVNASHYRGGTYQFAPGQNGRMTVTQTQTWRDSFSGYSPTCTQQDVINQNPSSALETADCYHQTNNGWCGSDPMEYTVTFVGDDYCYGDGTHEMAIPAEPFTYGWGSCCWVTFTSDTGLQVSQGGMTQIARVNDVMNNSPSIKHPPIWLIMAQCDDQTIDLNPTDADGDRVQCRWATPTEAGGAYTDLTMWPSLSLDQDNCIVTYTGSKDANGSGVKPIALMMEDFDTQGNVRSSVPVQFLATVWTPDLNARSLSYPNWFGEDHDDDHHHDDHDDDIDEAKLHKKIARGRRSGPSYCTAVPVFIGDTPHDQSEINFTGDGELTFTLQASSQLGSIVNFAYQAPLGLTCSLVDQSNGSVDCTWTPTDDQKAQQSHQFCFDATDSVGLKTERRCITIEINAIRITNINECALAILSNPGDWSDYGCAGRGIFDAWSTTLGKQVDDADRAFYNWKQCYHCASGGDVNNVESYDYDINNDSCANSTPSSRAYCECDRKLIQVLSSENAKFGAYDTNQCQQAQNKPKVSCCQYDVFMWEGFNANAMACCQDGVRPIGTC